jgi:hypothetical protein
LRPGVVEHFGTVDVPGETGDFVIRKSRPILDGRALCFSGLGVQAGLIFRGNRDFDFEGYAPRACLDNLTCPR